MKDTPVVVGLIVAAVMAVAFFIFVGKQPAPIPPPPPAPAPAPIPPAKRLKLVYLTMKNCPACSKMERQTLNDASVAKLIAERFDFEKVAQDDRRWKAAAYPTCIVLAADGAELQRAVGFKTPENFVAWLRLAIQETFAADWRPS